MVPYCPSCYTPPLSYKYEAIVARFYVLFLHSFSFRFLFQEFPNDLGIGVLLVGISDESPLPFLYFYFLTLHKSAWLDYRRAANCINRTSLISTIFLSRKYIIGINTCNVDALVGTYRYKFICNA